ncbi:hypothetical protein KT71_003387 [Congregibacter litoralis KT71]|uniref:Uncharacterized protein n=1 Tax=Congregibacter litoralis KT71 TaxID=314285 RepID=V7HUZ9_9GAMM|nr:hypothetical protein KT71_003387 [Congregibacter litoralis KT71]
MTETIRRFEQELSGAAVTAFRTPNVALGLGRIKALSGVDILADCADRTCRPVEVSIY